MSRWDLRHPMMIRVCWLVAVVLFFYIIASRMDQPKYSSDKRYVQPPPSTFYQPLSCWPDGDQPTMQCQRPYVPPENKAIH